VAHYLIQTRRKPANSSEAPTSETEAVISDNTEAADTNQPKPEIVSEKSDVSIRAISLDESSAADDGQSMAKRRQVKRKQGEVHCGNFAPGPIASRLRSRQKEV
jgi:hypothetical protein